MLHHRGGLRHDEQGQHATILATAEPLRAAVFIELFACDLAPALAEYLNGGQFLGAGFTADPFRGKPDLAHVGISACRALVAQADARASFLYGIKG